jgi:hypothetical protein
MQSGACCQNNTCKNSKCYWMGLLRLLRVAHFVQSTILLITSALAALLSCMLKCLPSRVQRAIQQNHLLTAHQRMVSTRSVVADCMFAALLSHQSCVALVDSASQGTWSASQCLTCCGGAADVRDAVRKACSKCWSGFTNSQHSSISQSATS